MRLRFVNSLQAKVTVAFLVVSLAPLGVVSVFSLRTADAVIEGIMTSQLENVAAEKQDLLERWLAEREADLEVVGGSALVRSLDAARIAPYLELVRKHYLVYDRFVVAGPDGATVYDDAGEPGASCAGEAWYREAMAGRTYMSEVHLDRAGRGSVFLLASPVRGPDDRPAGVVCATVDTGAILAQVLRVALGETGECYLVDGAGTFLAHKEPRRILRESIAQSETFARIFPGTRSRPIYTDYRGIPVLGSSRPIGETGWYVVVEQDRDEAFAGSDRLRWRICGIIALTIVAASCLSWLLGYYVAAPIRTLSEAADRLARGEFDIALAGAPTVRRDEIGVLYAAFENMAAQLQKRHVRLRKRVGRTRAQLRRADVKLKQTLEAAARSEHLAALGRLASGVAHEIRTPLASLKLYMQSIREEIAHDSEHHEDFEIAMRQVGRIEGTINHFLEFARPQEPVPVEVDFPRLVEDALSVVGPRARQQSVEVGKSIVAGLPVVEGDMRQLGDALVNLLVNALEVMPDGGRVDVAVDVDRPEAQNAGPTAVRIDVTDSGPGIEAGHLERLFEPFFTTKATGSGLGLAIVAGTVERHGGEVRVHTRPGEGTRFSIVLPAATRPIED